MKLMFLVLSFWSGITTLAHAAEPPPDHCGFFLERPRLLATQAIDQKFAGYTYHIEGELVPLLTVELQKNQSVFFEHHLLNFKHPLVKISIRKLKGLFKRAIAGMDIFITQASGPGQIALSRDGAGQIFALQLKPGEKIEVREHQFVAATGNIDFTFRCVRGLTNIFFGNSGYFNDRFEAPPNKSGIVWLHGYGNVFEKVLAEGESIDVETGGWIYRDLSVRMETIYTSFSAGLFATPKRLNLNRFTGPGRIAIQSLYMY